MSTPEPMTELDTMLRQLMDILPDYQPLTGQQEEVLLAHYGIAHKLLYGFDAPSAVGYQPSTPATSS